MSPTTVTQVTLPNGEIVSVMASRFAKPDAEAERLRSSAAKAGANAVAKSLAQGVPVTVVKDGKVVRINPDKTEEVIEALA